MHSKSTTQHSAYIAYVWATSLSTYHQSRLHSLFHQPHHVMLGKISPKGLSIQILTQWLFTTIFNQHCSTLLLLKFISSLWISNPHWLFWTIWILFTYFLPSFIPTTLSNSNLSIVSRIVWLGKLNPRQWSELWGVSMYFFDFENEPFFFPNYTLCHY